MRQSLRANTSETVRTLPPLPVYPASARQASEADGLLLLDGQAVHATLDRADDLYVPAAHPEHPPGPLVPPQPLRVRHEKGRVERNVRGQCAAQASHTQFRVRRSS